MRISAIYRAFLPAYFDFQFLNIEALKHFGGSQRIRDTHLETVWLVERRCPRKKLFKTIYVAPESSMLLLRWNLVGFPFEIELEIIKKTVYMCVWKLRPSIHQFVVPSHCWHNWMKGELHPIPTYSSIVFNCHQSFSNVAWIKLKWIRKIANFRNNVYLLNVVNLIFVKLMTSYVRLCER